MKQRISALLLALCLICALAVPASAAGENAALQAVRVLGIVTAADTSAAVTRADFAKMLTAASSYKDSVGTEGAGYSLFKDVKSTYWASEYIHLAIQEGWMTGYTDGTFRPDQGVTLEEACSAALKLLGYDSASLAGSFPSAQLNKAAALGLRSGISKQKGQVLTVGNCAQLFYNLMTAKASSGQIYGTALGYTVTNGELDYTSTVLDSVSGPYVADGGAALPFTPATIYRNGELTSSAALDQYDVYYYNETLSTLWVYTERVSGELTDIAPNASAPTSVTLAGETYSISSQTAAYKLSALGGGSTGSYVTLLLGMDGGAVDVLTGDEVDQSYCGVVTASSRSGKEGSVRTTVTLFCTDGISRTFTLDKSAAYPAGRLLSVKVTASGVSAASLASNKSVSGQVNAAGTKLGSLPFADDIEILDVSSEGDAVVVKPSRLAGYTLNTTDVRYCGLNAAGQIERLILNDATGDTWTYGYMTGVENQSQGDNIAFSYSYVIDGTASTLRTNGIKYPVTQLGGFAVRYNADKSVKSMRELQSVKLTSLSSQSAMADNRRYNLAEDVQVYLQQDGILYLTDLSEINAEDYSLTGWYDGSAHSAGGQIRIIVARATA